jgi:hypothetical protein
VLLSWVLKRHNGWPGAVTRAFNTTKMLDRICAKHGRELIEHGIGFKFVCDYMLEREIVMGGEESGGIGFQRHLPERDGLLNCAAAGQRDGRGRQDAGPTGRRSAGRVRRAPVRPHRPAYLPDDIKNGAIARAARLSPATRSLPECPSCARRIWTA